MSESLRLPSTAEEIREALNGVCADDVLQNMYEHFAVHAGETKTTGEFFWMFAAGLCGQGISSDPHEVYRYFTTYGNQWVEVLIGQHYPNAANDTKQAIALQLEKLAREIGL